MNLRQKLDVMFHSYNVKFNIGWSNAVSYWPYIAMEVPSSGSEEDYAWLGDMPNMREWVGERVVKEIEEKMYSIRNETYEATVAVPVERVADDQYGLYGTNMERMGEAAKKWADQLVFNRLTKGFNEKCYDGQSFFSASHPVGNKSVSNRSNKPLNVANYAEARSALMAFTNDEGEPLGIVPNLLVVPPQLEETARRILKSDLIVNGAATESNPWKDSAEVLVVPRLATYPKMWFLMQTDGVLKPLIWQIREEANFQALTDPNSENVFKEKKFLFGTSARGNAGFGLWQMAFGSTGE